jgi:hypothetical protein
VASDGDQPHHRPNGGVRARLLQEELDRRFTTVEREIILRFEAAGQALIAQQEEISRRFDGMRREVDQRFDSTIHMRVALQEEMDRRFTDFASQLDRRFQDSERAVQAALAAAKEAVLKAETASERRFEGVNEFRAQLNDQARAFLTRTESEAKLTAITDRITVNAERLAALELRLTSRLDLGAGRDSGAQDYRTNAQQEEMVRTAVKQASATSAARLNLTAAFSGLAVLVSVIVLIVGLATGHLLWRSPSRNSLTP